MRRAGGIADSATLWFAVVAKFSQLNPAYSDWVLAEAFLFFRKNTFSRLILSYKIKLTISKQTPIGDRQ